MSLALHKNIKREREREMYIIKIKLRKSKEERYEKVRNRKEDKKNKEWMPKKSRETSRKHFRNIKKLDLTP